MAEERECARYGSKPRSRMLDYITASKKMKEEGKIKKKET